MWRSVLAYDMTASDPRQRESLCLNAKIVEAIGQLLAPRSGTAVGLVDRATRKRAEIIVNTMMASINGNGCKIVSAETLSRPCTEPAGVTKEMFEVAREAWHKTYEAEYFQGVTRDNKDRALRAALEAALGILGALPEMTWCRWQPVDTLPDVMNRPARCFIRVEGWKQYAGEMWNRVWCDLVHTSSETQWGVRREDMDRIMLLGDMDRIDSITHWMPVRFPALEIENAKP
jgi:hypothetical protein